MHFVDAHQTLTIGLQIAYYSLIFQPLVICLALPLRRQPDRLAQYQLATLMSLLITILLFAAFPVTTAWTYSGGAELAEAQRLHLIGTDSGWVHQLMEIREGHGRNLDWGVDARIIGFPSFHCAGALINCWAVWNIRSLRVGALIVNGLLIAATPIIGGHYLVDLIAGAGVAALGVVTGLGASRRLVNSTPIPATANLTAWGFSQKLR